MARKMWQWQLKLFEATQRCADSDTVLCFLDKSILYVGALPAQA